MAIFRHGECRMVDYTPESAVTAGDVIILGAVPYVAHLDIEADRLGALAADGGVYDVTAGEELAAGEAVYYDPSDDKVYLTDGGDADLVHFGYVVPQGGAAADATARVHHSPSGGVSTGSA